MKIKDIFEDTISESAIRIWARNGNKIVQKYRCISGPKKGRIVSDPATCSRPVDPRKRQQMRQLRARKGRSMTRKAVKARKLNPLSRRVAQLNKHR